MGSSRIGGFPVGSFGNTAAPVWPAEQKTSGSKVVFTPSVTAPQTLPFVALLDLAEWECMPFAWKGRWWQYAEFGTALGGAVAVPDCDGPQDVLSVAARVAFMGLDLAQVRRFGEDLRVDGPMHSFCDALCTVIGKVLELPEAQVLDIVRLRCVPNDHSSATQAFMSLDAGLEIFTKSDEKEIREQQDKIRAKTREAEAFAHEYKQRRARNRPPEPKAKAKAKALVKERRARWCALAPEATPPGFIPQEDAKKYLPPRASIWRMPRMRGWACHYPPYPRVSFRFDRWGERASVVLCWQHCWRLFLIDEGLDESACPIRGVFDETFEPISA